MEVSMEVSTKAMQQRLETTRGARHPLSQGQRHEGSAHPLTRRARAKLRPQYADRPLALPTGLFRPDSVHRGIPRAIRAPDSRCELHRAIASVSRRLRGRTRDPPRMVDGKTI